MKMLRRLLPDEAFTLWADEFAGEPRSKRAHAVLHRRAPFVGLVDADRTFLRLVDRRAFLEEIVKRMEQ